ncbi:MAG: sulfotransferase domain-containing protein [Sulfitobacter sp.]|jgi:hypothetical protein
MTSITKKHISINNVDVSFDVDFSAIDLPALVCFGIRKSGSTMLHKIVNQMAELHGKSFVDIPGVMFSNGLTVSDWKRDERVGEVFVGGNLYTGFRAFPAIFGKMPTYRQARKVFMFRDPRDALVSQYFSDAYSHKIPVRESRGRDLFLAKREEALNTDINEWVLIKSPALRQTFMEYVPVLNDNSCLKLRYEDYVFQKKRLIFHIAGQFNWEISDDNAETILASIDYVPAVEDDKRFVRKAIPGDHRDKLDKATIRKLNHRLGSALKEYDYY